MQFVVPFVVFVCRKGFANDLMQFVVPFAVFVCRKEFGAVRKDVSAALQNEWFQCSGDVSSACMTIVVVDFSNLQDGRFSATDTGFLVYACFRNLEGRIAPRKTPIFMELVISWTAALQEEWSYVQLRCNQCGYSISMMLFWTSMIWNFMIMLLCTTWKSAFPWGMRWVSRKLSESKVYSWNSVLRNSKLSKTFLGIQLDTWWCLLHCIIFFH